MKTTTTTGLHRLPALALTALAAALVPGFASAQTWNGAGGDSNWSTGANWVGGIAPASGAGTTVLFTAPGGAVPSVVDSAFTLNRLWFVPGAFYTLSGAAISFDGVSPRLIVAAPSTIANDLAFLVTTTIEAQTDFTLTGQTAGIAGLTKEGVGRLTLAGVALTWGGATTVNAGVLQIGNGATGPNFFGSPIVVNGEIDFAGTVPGINVANTVSGTGTVTVSGGTMISGGAPWTHTGPTNVTGGSISAGFNTPGRLTVTGTGVVQTGDSFFGSLAGTAAASVFSNSTAITIGSDNTSTTYSGQLAGTGGITKVGTGRLTLTGIPPLWGGPTTVSAGVLQIGDGATGPNFFGSPIVVNGEIDFAGTVPGINVANTVSGTGTVTVSGGTMIGGGAPWTHTGPTNVTGGSISAGFNTPGRLTVTGTGVVQTGDSFFGSLAGTAAASVSSNATAITIGSDNTSTTFSGQLAGTGGITKVGTGRLTLSGSPLTWGGTTTVSAGVLQIGNGATGPNFFGSPMIVNGEIDFAGTVPGINVANTVSGTGTVTVSGGTMIGGGAPWTHTGPTNVTGGSISAGFNTPGPLTVTGTGVVQTGDSAFGSLAGTALASVSSNATAITIGSNNASTTYSGTLGGVGGLTKVGLGTFTLGGTLTMGGPLTINGGRVNLLATGPGGATVNAGGTLGGTGGLGGSVTVNVGGTLAPGLSPGTINTGDLNVAGTLAAEILGTTAGTQYDVVNVTGTVTLSGTLSLSGAFVPALGDVFTIVVNDGADAVTGTFAGLAEGATVLFNGVTLRISYIGGTGNDVTLTAVSTTNVVWNGGGANDNWSTGINWVSGVAPASGATTFVTFPGASARFTPNVDAAWTINRMDITSGTAYTLGGSAITFAGAAPQLNVTTGAHTIGNALTLSASLAVANATNLTLSGAIGGGGGLAKSGAGRLAINGAGAWTGGTTISGGTLLANGTVPGPLTVNAGGTLGGTGTVAGPVTVNAGGSIAPGLSPGITNTGNLSIAGTLVIEIEGTTIGTQYDNVNVTGTVGIAGGALLVTGAFVPVAGTVFTIVSNDGADAVTGTFLGLAEGATVTLNGVPLVISYVGGTGNDITLTAQAAVAVAVPTLGEWAMLLLVLGVGLAGALSLKRREGGLAA
jgi:fibronectin-binding autotransporter adhesin